MAKMRSILLLGTLGVLLLGGFLGYLLTPRETKPEELSPNGLPARGTLVDETPLQRARALLAIASTEEEQQVALEAIQIADQEVDLAYAMALRQSRSRSPSLTGE